MCSACCLLPMWIPLNVKLGHLINSCHWQLLHLHRLHQGYVRTADKHFLGHFSRLVSQRLIFKAFQGILGRTVFLAVLVWGRGQPGVTL